MERRYYVWFWNVGLGNSAIKVSRFWSWQDSTLRIIHAVYGERMWGMWKWLLFFLERWWRFKTQCELQFARLHDISSFFASPRFAGITLTGSVRFLMFPKGCLSPAWFNNLMFPSCLGISCEPYLMNLNWCGQGDYVFGRRRVGSYRNKARLESKLNTVPHLLVV